MYPLFAATFLNGWKHVDGATMVTLQEIPVHPGCSDHYGGKHPVGESGSGPGE